MRVHLTAEDQAALTAAAAAERRVRHWRRYQAILLLTEASPEDVARASGCSRARVYAWATLWEQGGLVGVQEAPRAGRTRLLAAEGEAALAAPWRPCLPPIPKPTASTPLAGACPCGAPTWRGGATRSASAACGARGTGGAGAGSGRNTCSAARTPTTPPKRRGGRAGPGRAERRWRGLGGRRDDLA